MRWIAILAVVLSIAGCSTNHVEVRNVAAGGIYFLFQGERRYVSPGASHTIEDIPNGGFSYSTVFEVPAGFRGVDSSMEGLSGTMTFIRNQTHYTVLYGSTSFDGIYSVNASVISNDPVSPTGP